MNRSVESIATATPLQAAAASDYLALTKPRVVSLIVLTTAMGFLMGSTSIGAEVSAALLLNTLLGTALVAGGTLALNQYLERDLDARMRRTRTRPLPAGRMRPSEALLFGGALTAAGLVWLTVVRPLAGLLTALTVIGYLFLYTPLKTRTALCTVLGAFPGALPPLTGWAAATDGIGPGGILLFGILFFWQIPHSLAIAHLYREDYEKASIRLLPTVDRTHGSLGRQVVINCIALIWMGMLPAMIGLTGRISMLVALALGGWMLARGIALAVDPTSLRARRLLMASYVYVPLVLTALALDRGPA